MKIRQFLALALIGLVLGSCKRPDGDDPDASGPEGRLVKTKLSFNLPKSIQTYAPGDGDDYVTAEELDVNTIDVFFYDDGGRYAVEHFQFDIEANPGLLTTGTSPDRWAIDDEMEITEGPKLVYVGINLPQFIVDRFLQGYYVNEVFENINLADELIDDISGGSSSIAYFNSAEKRVQIGAFGSPADPDEGGVAIVVDVERLVAKIVVTVGTDDTSPTVDWWHVNGGTVSDFAFSVGQLNRQMYVSPFKFHNNNGEDPNWTVGSASGTFGGTPILQPTITADYLSVHNYNNDGALDLTDSGTPVHYVPENTLDDDGTGARHDDVTFVSVRATFLPDEFEDAEPGGWDGTFHAVFTGDDTDGVDALGARYFHTLANAEAYVGGTYFQSLLSDTYTVPADYIHTYDQGYCYYRIYINPSEGYSINRNTVYRVNIRSVNYIGTTGKDDLPGGEGSPMDPGDPVPTLPGFPVVATQPISQMPQAYLGIESEITVQDWVTPPAADYDLY